MASKYGELHVIPNFSFLFLFLFYLLYLYQATISCFTFPSVLKVYMANIPHFNREIGAETE